MARISKPVTAGIRGTEKLSRQRQRQKLIDACISALYVHGPTRTTIDKVVRIAAMSPGIVNFYFETKAALLMAVLDYLAVEFEERVLAPLQAMRNEPARALNRLVDLYLDEEIASPRKVSAWYAFWGEASSRSEYQAICGKRDQAFADLVRDLIARLVRRDNIRHLDPDAIALGLIGCLEILWQEIAFHDEAAVDLRGARRRCRSYLASVFPAEFERLIDESGRGYSVVPTPERSSASVSSATQSHQAQLSRPTALAGAIMLVVAELRFADIPAEAGNWPDYHIIAQPGRQAPQRVVVAAIADWQTPVPPTPDAAYDWLAIVICATGHRRIFVIPRQTVQDLLIVKATERPDGRLSDEEQAELQRYEGVNRLRSST